MDSVIASLLPLIVGAAVVPIWIIIVLLLLSNVLAAQSLVLIPIVVYATAPTRSTKTLETARLWLEEHNRMIMITVSLIFGLFFLFKGITGLTG